MRALIVTNMWPTPAHPALGSFVRDQVAALRTLDGIDVEVFAFGGGSPLSYARAAARLRRAHRGDSFDVVHAHFGLSAPVALALPGVPHAVTLHGTDVRHPRSGRITRAVLPRLDLVAAVSQSLADELDATHLKAPVAVLPCGVDAARFVPIDRREARRRLGLDPEEPCLLFPADPARPGKRFDHARELAGSTRLLTLGEVPPEEVPLRVNAANAVLVPSDSEGYGLAVLEALACDVPVLATPTGIHAEALEGIAGTLCAPFDTARWQAALEPHLTRADPRIAGRARTERHSARRMAERVVARWSALTTPASTGHVRHRRR